MINLFIHQVPRCNYNNPHFKHIYVICRLGGPCWKKLCQQSVFPNTDQPRLANNMFIFFYGIAVKGSKMSIMSREMMLIEKEPMA